ncbi:unnamed protein product [Owenia fusiformis]|uniref:Uncharacterized protein n=1 Tax=Owenia fusiformis TaxID=6347 RepID=A0A8J1URC8_OWEFU|nr:unnamed protein product [Owenia fusiformis]
MPRLTIYKIAILSYLLIVSFYSRNNDGTGRVNAETTITMATTTDYQSNTTYTLTTAKSLNDTIYATETESTTEPTTETDDITTESVITEAEEPSTDVVETDEPTTETDVITTESAIIETHEPTTNSTSYPSTSTQRLTSPNRTTKPTPTTYPSTSTQRLTSPNRTTTPAPTIFPSTSTQRSSSSTERIQPANTTTTVSTTPPPSIPPIITGLELSMDGLTIQLTGSEFYEELNNGSLGLFDDLAYEVEWFLLRSDHNGGLDLYGDLLHCGVNKFMNGSIIVEFDLVYELYSVNVSQGIQPLKDHVSEVILSMGDKSFFADSIWSNLTVNSTYSLEVTSRQIQMVSLCNNKGNLLRCDHGHRCHEHNGVPGCYSLCQPTPYGTWTPESCNEGTCSLSDATDPSANATTVCRCNAGFFQLSGECNSYILIVAIVAGCLGGAVLLLIIIIIVCAIKKRSKPGIESMEMMQHNPASDGTRNDHDDIDRRRPPFDREVSLYFVNDAHSEDEHSKEDEMQPKYDLSNSLRIRLEKEHSGFFPPLPMDGTDKRSNTN